MGIIRNLLIGISRAFDVLANHRPYTSLDNGFAKDKQALRGDFDKSIENLNRQIRGEDSKDKCPYKSIGRRNQ